MTNKLLDYFAFGSNLSSPRLRRRIPDALPYCVAVLKAHQLCWHKNDSGQSGKCDIVATSQHEARVYGVVYRMSATDSLELDRYEGSGFGYHRRQVSVEMPSGEYIKAFTYQALDIDQTQRPYHWYKEHVLRGALEHDLPAAYLDFIRATLSIEDPDRERHQRELEIYRQLPPLE